MAGEREMTIIDTTEDLLRLLDENEQFLGAARHKILTEDLIRLPSEFKEYAKKTDARFDAVEDEIKR